MVSSLAVASSLALIWANNVLGVSAAKGVPADTSDLTEATVPLRTHSLYGPYVDNDLQNRWWDFGADTIINTNKGIRLTQDRPSEQGWLWSRLPLTSPNYQIEWEFKIDSKGSNIFGDGMAMWLTKDRAQPGPVFGSKDQFYGLGVFFDTYANTRHSYTFPRVTAMMGDGRKSYDAGTDGAQNELAGCSANYRRTEVPTKARLTYIRGHHLELELHYKSWDEWTPCFKVNVTMPSSPYVGFSALTGQVSEYHDIISVTASSAVLRGENAALMNRGRGNGHADRHDKKTGLSWFLFMLKGIALFALVAFGYSFYKTWAAKARKKARMKREW
ncbi:Lectin VIP36, involved in the transport of glycoproteins carrying high mannose-type glycans [Phaffia rhodozyma]|uniref:Lectin VIP36, involved in the transport of glycoproteins carrying high mannose-type glycans n=1 Tax=Phaffia rhodozyma TaxID=264483 RepID=A0A0F7SU15_PHARH|nr:Lectin VIP36, involved in the transport of glycoproteins carrying high mannose-type glycans [Phaffia rhodozyma]